MYDIRRARIVAAGIVTGSAYDKVCNPVSVKIACRRDRKPDAVDRGLSDNLEPAGPGGNRIQIDG